MVIRRTRVVTGFTLILMSVFSGMVLAQDFDSLTSQQQALLAPLEEKWDQLPAPRKARVVAMADRMADKSAEEQEQFQEGLNRFISMQGPQRQQVRAVFDRFRLLPPGERQRVIDRVSTMTEEQRQAFVLGMRVADRTNRMGGGIERFLRSLPADERQALFEEIRPLPAPQKLRRVADEMEARGVGSDPEDSG